MRHFNKWTRKSLLLFRLCFLIEKIWGEKLTRFGPNRPAADMERNGEIDFWGIFEDFWRHS